jgi:hypothetical protein
MVAGVLAAYDRVLVWLGLRSRHASRATAATPRSYRARHYLLAVGERIEPQADGSLVAPVAGLYRIGYPAGSKGLSLMAPPPASMSKPRLPATDQPRPGSLTAEKVAELYGVPAHIGAMANDLRSIRWESDRSLSEFGQRIADSLMPWFDKTADTVVLPAYVDQLHAQLDPNGPSLHVDWRDGQTEQPMTRYGRADKI